MQSQSKNILGEWLVSFAKVLLLPTPRTFRELAENASGKFSTSVFWLVMVAVFSFLHGYFNSEPKISIGALFVLVLFLPFAVLAWATSIHFIYQRLFKQTKDLLIELIYALTCIGVLFFGLNAVLVNVPIIGDALGYLTWLYALLLALVAVYAITDLNVVQALITIILGTILGACITIFGVMFFYSLSDVNDRIF